MPSGQVAAVERRREIGTRTDIARFYPVSAPRQSGYVQPILGSRLRHAGLRGWHLHAMSLGSVGLCLGLWIRAKTVDQPARENAERRAIFVGLWPPMLWLIGDSIDRA